MLPILKKSCNLFPKSLMFFIKKVECFLQKKNILFFLPFQNKTLPCACVDCEQSCPVPPPPPPTPKPFTIFGLDGYKVCMAVLFVVLSTLFLIGVCLYPSKSIDGELLHKNIVIFYTYM